MRAVDDKALPRGDPAALGRVVLEAIETEAPLAHLLVGPNALSIVRGRLAQWSEGFDRWQSLSHASGQG